MSNQNPFGGIPVCGELAKRVGRQGPVAWDPATQLALAIATDGETEQNVDPLERIRFEQLARVAEVHVNGVTGLSINSGGHLVNIEPVTRSQWVLRTIEAYRPRFEALAAQLSATSTESIPSSEDAPPTPDSSRAAPPVPGLEDLVGMGDELSQFDVPLANPPGSEGHPSRLDPDALGEEDADSWLSGMLSLLSPMLLGMTAGSLIGHLSRRSFGTYDLPLPRPVGAPIMVLPGTIGEFEKEWDLDGDTVRLALCIRELTFHAVLGIPHVQARLDELLAAFATDFQPDPDALERRLGDLDPSNPEGMASFQQILGDPEILVGASAGPAQRERRAQIDALVAAIVGYVDHVMDVIGGRLIDSYPQISEALRRRRVTESDSDRFTARLFGLELGQDLCDRGNAFAAGIVERAGDDGLNRLWSSPDHLPTIAEVDAPGLWLARIDLPGDG